MTLDMIDELLNLCDDEFIEYGGQYFLQALQNEKRRLTLQLLTHAPHLSEEKQISSWELRCDGVRDFLFHSGGYSRIELSTDSPVLWPYSKPTKSLYFSGQPTDKFKFESEILVAHQRSTNGQLKSGLHLNRNVSLADRLLYPYGLLAAGPEPLMLEYGKVCQRYGLEVSILDATEIKNEGPQLYAIMFDDSYVVAEHFDVEKTK